MISKDKQEKFIELRAKGYSFDSIVKEIEVSKPTLIKWQTELKREIKNFEYAIYQGLIESYKKGREKRVQGFTELLEKINKELVSRELTTFTIKDLLLLKTELQQDFNKEIQNIKYHTGEMKDIFENSMQTETTIDL